MVLQRLTIDDDLLAVKEDKCYPPPLVCVVPPEMVGSSLDASIAWLQRSLFARVELELNLTKDDDAVIKRSGAVHGTARTGWNVDKADYRTIVIV